MPLPPPDRLTFAVMGTGGVGGYFGARLVEAGADVRFVARGRHLEAIQAEGLRIESEAGNVTIRPRIAADPASLGPVDVVLFAVKLYDVEDAGAKIAPLLHPDTIVVALQNGVDSEERLARVIPAHHVMGGVSYIFSAIEKPGVIRHTGRHARILFGELDRRRSARAEALLAALKRGGFDVKLADDIEAEWWIKFIFLASFSGLACLARLPAGPMLREPEAFELLTEAMREAEAVGRAKGVKIPPDAVAQHVERARAFDPRMTPSMLHDLLAGRRLEVPWLSGAVARLGAELGVPTPIHRTAYALLKAHAGGAVRPA